MWLRTCADSRWFLHQQPFVLLRPDLGSPDEKELDLMAELRAWGQPKPTILINARSRVRVAGHDLLGIDASHDRHRALLGIA
jgi:hypothetical protein